MNAIPKRMVSYIDNAPVACVCGDCVLLRTTIEVKGSDLVHIEYWGCVAPYSCPADDYFDVGVQYVTKLEPVR